MKIFPATPDSVSLSASMISESKDYSAKLPDLPATAIGDEYPAANISESGDPPSNFLVETDNDTNMSEEIESPDMSPFTSDEDEVPLTNQHLQTANYNSHCRGALLPISTIESCIHSETESASDHELPGVLDTILMESSDSDMELSADNDSSNNLPEISTVSDKDELTDCILLNSPMSGIISDNPAPHSPASEDINFTYCKT